MDPAREPEPEPAPAATKAPAPPTSPPPAPAPRGGGAPHETPLLARDASDRLSQRLHQAVTGFVDAPQDAVQEADRVLEEAAARFAEAVSHRRHALRTAWQPADGGGNGGTRTPAGTDTEQLRLALRDYRELTERLLRL